jgi:hypothetical protein
MRRTSVSRPHHLVCPACGYGALHPRGPLSRSAYYYCESCWCSFGDAIVGTLKQIATLPDAVGKHACEECAHPEDALSARWDVLLPRLPIRGGACRIQHLCVAVSQAEGEGEQRGLLGSCDRQDREGRAGLVEDSS